MSVSTWCTANSKILKTSGEELCFKERGNILFPMLVILCLASNDDDGNDGGEEKVGFLGLFSCL
jgi:hypothetical protein